MKTWQARYSNSKVDCAATRLLTTYTPLNAALLCLALIPELAHSQAGINEATAPQQPPIHKEKKAARIPAQFEGIIRQTSDASCAAAALATLLTFHLNKPSTEQELLKTVESDGSKPLSALDLKKMAASRGVHVRVLTVPQHALDTTFGLLPAIVRIKERPEIEKATGELTNEEAADYHFAVLTKIEHRMVFLKDPVIGNRVMSKQSFLRLWLDPKLGTNSESGVVVSNYIPKGDKP